MKFRHRKYRPALPHVVQRDTTGVVGLMPKMNASESPQKRERERERERVRERERRGRERESQREREGEREREERKLTLSHSHYHSGSLKEHPVMYQQDTVRHKNPEIPERNGNVMKLNSLWQFERTFRKISARLNIIRHKIPEIKLRNP